MNQPKPIPEKYRDLIQDIERGYIKIPQFQRDFVWSIEATANLLDSIIKGFPIGAFTIWKTRERLKSVKDIGGNGLPSIPEGDSVKYILDGQQRLTSLYVALKGLTVLKNGKPIDYKEIYIDLSKDIDDSDPIVTTDRPENDWISVYDLLTGDLTYLVDAYRGYLTKIETYKNRFTTYDFSTIVLEDYAMNVAVEIFTRINTTGTELTLFEIMSATTYDEIKNFDMKEKYGDLQEELEDVKYSIPGLPPVF